MGFVFSGRSAYEEADVPATQLGFIRCTLPSGAEACSDSNIQTVESAWVTSDRKNLETRSMLSNCGGCGRRVAHDRLPYQLRESFQESLFAGMRVPIKSSSFTFDRTTLTRYKQRCSHSLLVPRPNPCTVRRRRITSITPSHHCNQRRIVRTEPSRPYQSESDACLLQPRIPHLGQT
jgi:hypothetical protein